MSDVEKNTQDSLHGIILLKDFFQRRVIIIGGSL